MADSETKETLTEPPKKIKKETSETKSESVETEAPSNVKRKIPEAVFLEDVDSFMLSPENNGNCEKVLKALDEQHNDYERMELLLLDRRKRISDQKPDLLSSLKIIEKIKRHLKGNPKQKLRMQFLLSDQVYTQASAQPEDKIFLWLGANVMLEYTLDDATELLQSNVKSAEDQLENIEKDLEFVKDQTTITEVNMARVYNWDVKRRQEMKNIPATKPAI